MNFSQLNNLELEEKIVEANFDNDLTVLRDIFLEKKLADIKKITDLEKWNSLLFKTKKRISTILH